MEMDVLTFQDLATHVDRHRRHRAAQEFVAARLAVNGEGKDAKKFLDQLVPPAERGEQLKKGETSEGLSAFMAAFGKGL